MRAVYGYGRPWTLATPEESPVRYRPLGFGIRYLIKYRLVPSSMVEGGCHRNSRLLATQQRKLLLPNKAEAAQRLRALPLNREVLGSILTTGELRDERIA
ncbi:hypothetical protein EVAR_21947_1 [Eumeta japonica]|uniref:Uncharacterized protein n=1 Tax=Eumeta variegata TaxID=151549 RepID=A0A4C1VWD8_EUMVA|nr:hypothetical protein EVAR_21947_1 [Eumeta japonica]